MKDERCAAAIDRSVKLRSTGMSSVGSKLNIKIRCEICPAAEIGVEIESGGLGKLQGNGTPIRFNAGSVFHRGEVHFSFSLVQFRA